MNNIVLLGMSGVGKTTVGKYIANKMNMKFIDTDEIIVNRCGITINNIFYNYGEQYFRNLEKKVIEEVSKYNGVVISTGGGVVLNNVNIYNLKNNGIIFLLKASIDTIYNNIKSNPLSEKNRPLLKRGSDLKNKIEKIYKKREKLYTSSSDYIIQVDGKSVNEVGDEIIFIFKKLNSCS